MSHGISFSFIMPTYNRAFCICTAIDSLLAQKTLSYELIIIDDGSTDNTEKVIITKYSAHLASGKIRFIKIEKGGVCKARNRGLIEAKYDWIAYLDSDNVLRSNFIEAFTDAITRHSNKTFYAKIQNQCSKAIIGHSFDYQQLLRSNFIDLGVFVHHKTIFSELGGFDENLKRLVDWDLILTYTRNYVPFFIDKVLLDYNDNDDFARITNSEIVACETVQTKHQQYIIEEEPQLKLIQKIKRVDGHRDIYFCGIKVFSYMHKSKM